MNFLQELLEITKEAESPRSFFYWSGLAAISAVVKRNVWIRKKYYRLYPNMYILLVAPSGIRKGLPIKIAQELVEALEVTKVISGMSSIQSIIRELSIQWTTESGKILTLGQCLLVNDELGTMLIKDEQAQTVLTALFDAFYHKTWKKNIKTEGTDLIKEPYITLLGATNPTNLHVFLNQSSILGGFIGRTCVVKETKKALINPIIEYSDNDNDDISEINLEPLTRKLEEISNLKGKFRYDNVKTVENYREWYIEFYKDLQDNTEPDETGTAERFGDLVLRIAMLLSMSERSDLIITNEYIEKGKDLALERLSDTTREIVNQTVVKSQDGSARNRLVLDYLLSQPDFKSTRKKLLRAKYGDLSAVELDASIDTLIQAELITREDTTEGPIFSIRSEYASKFKNYLSGKRVI